MHIVGLFFRGHTHLIHHEVHEEKPNKSLRVFLEKYLKSLAVYIPSPQPSPGGRGSNCLRYFMRISLQATFDKRMWL